MYLALPNQNDNKDCAKQNGSESLLSLGHFKWFWCTKAAFKRHKNSFMYCTVICSKRN